MERVSATRMALLAKRSQIALAEQGRDLLTRKRKALLTELQKLAAQVMDRSDALDQAAARARRSLLEAQALDGPEAIRSAALATRRKIEVTAQVVSVMGVQTPEITVPPISRGLPARGYGLTATTPRVDAIAQGFESVVEIALGLAIQEAQVRRLAQELRATMRRINALDHLLIPRLRAERDYIQMQLAEREREMTFRLKRLQAIRRAHQREAI